MYVFLTLCILRLIVIVFVKRLIFTLKETHLHHLLRGKGNEIAICTQVNNNYLEEMKQIERESI